ncbi:uncharacterized protein [Fopius arisanus]|uniref:Uncharacterized protein n=1 Tax=Fopius arisanus TaxID=64838 RepID=A0A9R1TI36_9HYME|nr:PREDICTED: uncharacterized protein LOC105270263 [Fopius arisanus]
MVRVHGGGPIEDIVFWSVNLPDDSAELPPTKELQKLVSYGRSHKLPLIIGCDAKSYHVVWESNKNNNRGTAQCQCVIDITLCDSRLVDWCVNWRVNYEDSLSDHRRKKFEIRGIAVTEQGLMRKNSKATDWSSCRRELKERLDERCVRPRNTDRLEDEVERIYRALTESFQTACPIKQGSNVMWRNRELGRQQGLTRRRWNQAFGPNSDEDWTQDRKVQKVFKNHIKKSKG